MSTGGTIPLGSLTMNVSGIVGAAKQADAQIVKLAKSIERSMQQSAEQTKKLTTAFGHIGGAMLKAAQEVASSSDRMSLAIRGLSNDMGEQRRAMAAYMKQVHEGFQKLVHQVDKLGTEMRTGFQQVAQQQERLKQEAGGVSSAWSRMGEAGRRAVDGLSRSLEPIRGKAREAGMAIGALTAATAGLTIAGVKIGNSYEQSFARIKGITRATAQEMAAMDKAAQDLGVSTVHSAREAAEGMAMMAQGGYKASQIISGMPAVFQLVDVAQTDTASATRVLVNVMEAMHVKAEELEGSVDMLAKALTLGGNNLEELATGFRYAGPLAKSLNIPLQEVLATLQLLGKQGIQGSMAGTTIRQMIATLAEMPAKVKKDFKQLGINIYDESGKLSSSLPKIFDELSRGFARSTKMGGMASSIMSDFSTRAGGGVTAILNAIEANRGVLENTSQEIGRAVGEKFSKGVSEEMRDTLPSRLSMVLGTMSGFGITLQKRIAPQSKGLLLDFNQWMSDHKAQIDAYINTAADKVRSFVASVSASGGRLYQAWAPTLRSIWQETKQVYAGFMQWFDSLPPGVQDALKVAGALTGVSLALGKIGGMIPLLGPFASAIAALINPIGLVGTAVKVLIPLLSAGGSGLIALLGLLFSPAGLVIAGVVAFTALAGYLNGDVVGAFKTLGQIIDTVTLGSLTRLLDLLKEVKGMFKDLVNDVKAKMESSARANNTREMVRTRYGDETLRAYDESLAAGNSLSAHRKRQQAIRESGGAQTAEDFTFMATADRVAGELGDKYRAAQERYEKAAEYAEKGIQQAEQNRKQRQMNAAAMGGSPEQQVKREQMWRDQQQVADQRALAPQIAQTQQAIGQAEQGNAAIQSGQFKSYFNSLTAKQAIDFYKSAPQAVMESLKPDKEGQITPEQFQKAKDTAATYISGLKQNAGVNPDAVKWLETYLNGAIESVAKAPAGTALRDMLIQELSNVDVKAHQVFTSMGQYAQEFAHSLAASLKKELDFLLEQINVKAGGAVAGHAVRQQIAQRQGLGFGPFAGAVAGQEAASQERIKAQQARVEEAIKNAGKEGLAPEDKKLADALVAAERADLERIIGEEKAKQGNVNAFLPPKQNQRQGRGLIGNQAARDAFNMQRQDLAGKMQTFRAGMGGQAGNPLSQQKQQASALQQQGQLVLQFLQQAMTLQGQEQQQALANALEARNAFDAMLAAAKRGQRGMDDFNKAAGNAGKAANKLAKTEQELEAIEEQKLNAQGKLSNRQQQTMQQFGQQAQQAFQQGMQQLQQGNEAQQQAAAQMDQQLTDALSSGDPAKVKAALGAMRGYATAQIQQTLTNVANAGGSDPIRVSFGTLSQPGILPSDFNALLRENPQAAATIKMFERIVAMLDATASKLPKMASGGIVTSPTIALIGESGPEAVVPLSGTPLTAGINAPLTNGGALAPKAMIIPMGTLNQLFGNPMGMFFPNNGVPLINPGGGSINPLGLNSGNLGAFGPSFRGIAGMLNQQIDLGNTGALGLLQKWQNVRQAAEDALGWMRQRRSIDLGGNGPAGRSPRYAVTGANNPYSAAYNPFGGGSGVSFNGMELHFHGYDISKPGEARRFAEELLPALDNAVRYRGADMTGRRPNNYYASGRAPGTPSGYSSIR